MKDKINQDSIIGLQRFLNNMYESPMKSNCTEKRRNLKGGPY